MADDQETTTPDGPEPDGVASGDESEAAISPDERSDLQPPELGGGHNGESHVPPKQSITFIDLKERDSRARDALKARQSELAALTKTSPQFTSSPSSGASAAAGAHGGAPQGDLEVRYAGIINTLPAAEQKEHTSIVSRLPAHLQTDYKTIIVDLYSKVDSGDGPAPVDPVFNAVRRALADISANIDGHVEGKLPTQRRNTPVPLAREEKYLVGVMGLLLLDSHTNTESAKFSGFITSAMREYSSNRALFEAVLDELVDDGDIIVDGQIRATQWAAIARALRSENTTADDPLLPLRVRSTLARVGGFGGGAPASTIGIDLPDLEAFTDVEIQVDNLYAMQALYFAAMLEELKVPQVVEKTLEMWQSGQLPLGRGSGGDLLYEYWKRSADRLSEVERRSLYARCFGFVGGASRQDNINRDFQTLFPRFNSATATFARQLQVDSLLRMDVPLSVSQEQVRKAGRDLAANLSLYGYGIAYFAAVELQDQIRDMTKLLSNEDIRSAFGARDMWQVIDQVAMLELGGARNSVRYRTLANSGAVIIRWLALNASKLTGSSYDNVIDPQSIRQPMPRGPGSKATADPTNYDLVTACEQYLAVSGIPQSEVDLLSEPVEAPMTTTRPIQVPSVARDLLEQAGVSLGMSMPNGAGRRVADGHYGPGRVDAHNGARRAPA